MSSREIMPLTLEDFYRFSHVTECALSPNGLNAAYIQRTPVKKHNDYTHNLWISPVDGTSMSQALSRGYVVDSMPRWSPDSQKIALISKRPEQNPEHHDDGAEPTAQIWMYDLEWGGDARQLTSRPEGVKSFSWSPNGQYLVFESRDPSEPQKQYLKSIHDKKSPGPLVINRTQHKTDEEGYLDNVPTHLFLYQFQGGEVRQLTQGIGSETDPLWSPDGQWILFRSNRTGDADNNRRIDLWIINPHTSEVRRLTQGDVEARYPQFSPDGHHVAFVSSTAPENNYVLNRLWTIDVDQAQTVTEFDHYFGHGWDVIGGIIPDDEPSDPVAAARVYPIPLRPTPMQLLSPDFDGVIEGPIRWHDTNSVLTLISQHGQQKLAQFTTEGECHVIHPQDRNGSLLQFDYQNDQTIGIFSLAETGPECVSIQGSQRTQLSHASSTWLTERTWRPFEWIRYSNTDGQEIEALVLTPPDFSQDRPSPLIVSIHGGPMSYEAPEFEFETQYWANRGYIVLLVNYRGSTSYGEAFCQSIQGHWGPMEHDDVMCGIDAVIARGWADPERLYCTGFSMGGIMTNWAIGHTDRFRAAVSEHGVWDYSSAFGTDDCHLWWQDDMGVPWQNARVYYETSPMSGLTNIHTPLLITAGEHDWRCPLNQAEQLYIALKKRGVPSELVIYPNEHHESDTRPARAIDRLRRIDEWFARYGGIPVTTDNQKS